MKKIFMISLCLAIISMSGCAMKPVESTISEKSTFSLINKQSTKYPYTRKMAKPEISSMNNRDAIQYGFHEPWKTTFTVPTDIDLSDPVYKENCLIS